MKIIFIFVAIVLAYLTFDYYCPSKVVTSSEDPFETTREVIDIYKKEKVVTKDTIHYSQAPIFLLSDGGRIEASCNDDFKIFIESQSNENSNSYSRLYYTFKTKKEYEKAVSYIKKKGFRWIVNHQFETEYTWDAKHEITWDAKNHMINNMYLTKMKEVQ